MTNIEDKICKVDLKLYTSFWILVANRMYDEAKRIDNISRSRMHIICEIIEDISNIKILAQAFDPIGTVYMNEQDFIMFSLRWGE